jgi:hypothetical protein
MVRSRGRCLTTFAMFTADEETTANQYKATKPNAEFHDGIAKQSIFLEEKMQSEAIILNKP